ncbi:MAG: CHAT domain-containing protein [Holophagales bacterium]|nr:CHAT domain-containing protein [Holophagales bacterium]
MADPRSAPARLAGTRAEAEALLALARSSGAAAPGFPGNGEPGAVALFSGFDAHKEAALGGGLSQYRFVHFATHAVVDSERPGLSGILLSPFDRRGRPRDDRLRALEVARLSLSAELVVLSACDTALGQEVRGEGLVGLGRSFLAAGAGALVVSLWKVDDRATAGLMERFYRGLLVEEMPAAAALRRAQLELAGDPAWRAPFHWAGFVVVGNGNGSRRGRAGDG